MKERLDKLLSVKSIVTLTQTLVFAYLAMTGKVSQEFMTVYTMIMGFYFGSQTARKEGER